MDVLPAYEYKDGKRTDKITGYRYEVAIPTHSLDKIGVKIDGEQRMEPPKDGFAEVEFTSLEVNAYERDGKVLFTAKTSGIAPASRKQP